MTDDVSSARKNYFVTKSRILTLVSFEISPRPTGIISNAADSSVYDPDSLPGKAESG